MVATDARYPDSREMTENAGIPQQAMHGCSTGGHGRMQCRRKPWTYAVQEKAMNEYSKKKSRDECWAGEGRSGNYFAN